MVGDRVQLRTSEIPSKIRHPVSENAPGNRGRYRPGCVNSYFYQMALHQESRIIEDKV
jgi:hypothetical protein